MCSTPDKTALRPCFVLLEPVTPKATTDFTLELKRTINERNILTTKSKRRVSEALEEIHLQNKEERNHTKKAKIIEEINESERNYVKQLEIIKNFFIKPIQERQLLKPDDFEVVFGYINTIYNINKILLEDLKKQPNNVAEAFSKIAPFFKSYSFYAFDYRKCLNILQNCEKTNSKFAKFLEMQESRPEVQSKLSALLITPIQRIPRYKLLLKPLFKLTSPYDENYEKLKDSLTKVEDAAEHINKIIKDRESMQRLIELQRCLSSHSPNLITPGRNLIREGILTRQATQNGGSNKQTYVVLTNDILMICKMLKESLKLKSLKCLGIYPLNTCKVVEILDKGAFRLVCQKEEIIFYNQSFEITKEWINDIKNTIETYISDRKTLKKECSTRRPVRRKDLSEYNEVGLSPGRPLTKKRKNPYGNDEDVEIDEKLMLTKRKALGNGQVCAISSSSVSLDDYAPSKQPTVTFGGATVENTVAKREDVFVFGGDNPSRGFSFKMNRIFTGIGSSVKKFFGIK